MQCPCCGAAELLHGVHDIIYTYKYETIVISSVKGGWAWLNMRGSCHG
ncbi:type II toxin-antitoxin system MqsA family antitoxin [Rhodoferax ferrireducens]